MKTRKLNKNGLMVSKISNPENQKILIKHLSNVPVIGKALKHAATEIGCSVQALTKHYYGYNNYSKSMLCRANMPIVTISGGKNYCFVNGKLVNGKQVGKKKGVSTTRIVMKQLVDKWFK